MTDKNSPPNAAETAKTREDRLKRALKANLARRKAQTRQRSGKAADEKQEQSKD